MNYVHVTLHKALSQAMSDGLIPRNVTDAVKSPRPAKPEIKPLSPDQARNLIATAYATGDRYAALYVLALHTGLRKGEMLGLRWDDLDLDATTPTLQVRRTLSETRNGHKFELPKSGRGRSIKSSRKAVEALRSHRVRQAEEKLRLGSLWQEGGLVFPSMTGSTTHPGATRPRQHKHHAGHVLPRHRGHGRWPRGRDGRCVMSRGRRWLPLSPKPRHRLP